jgi:hypothetical protein
MEKTLSAGIDYLGFLNNQLRDLRGYATLANELIQNADDAPEATEIVFDVRDDALIIENNGYFSECDQVDKPDCPWLDDPEIGHRCDFHRFRRTASGDKRRQEETIGAFGIGFIAVYQITGRPELISNGRHWIVRPEMSDRKKILVREPAPDISGTRFRLPWACDPDGGIRAELGVEPMTSEKQHDLLLELRHSLSSSLLFLRKLTRIELRHHGQIIKEIERIREEDQVLIEETSEQGSETNLWHLFRGDFGIEADRTRALFGGQIERQRSSKVIVAIPEIDSAGIDVVGLFHAFLPTHHRTGLPLHINADFYPSNDRKRILFEQDYQGRWNSAAVQASARVVAEALSDLPEILGHRGLWQLLEDIKELEDDAVDGSREPVMASFWEEIRQFVGELPLVYTSQGAWKQPSDVRVLQSRKKEVPCIPILEEIGLEVVHPDLIAYSNLLRRDEIGVRYLGASDLAQALRDTGLDEATPLEDAPEWIQSRDNREILSDEIDVLLSRSPQPQGLEDCAIACSVDDWLCPPSDLRRANPNDRGIFELLEHTAVFAAEDNPEAILALVPEFGVEDGLDLLEMTGSANLQLIWRLSPERFTSLLYWFAERPAEVRADRHNVERLQQLRICPSGEKLYSLEELVIPGGFEDHLQLTNVIDHRVLKRCEHFLREDLDAKILTLESYVTEHVPKAFESGHGVGNQARRHLVMILAERLGRIRDSHAAQEALSLCPLVECTDGAFRLPTTVYFPSELVETVLGTDVPIARLPQNQREAVSQLWSWLGVTEVPRPSEICRRIAQTVSEPPNQVRRTVIRGIFSRLGAEWERAFDEQHDAFEELKHWRWLPAKGDNEKWHRPADVYAEFSDYLFKSQGRFLEVPRNQQQNATALIDFLGIPVNPDVSQVVRHLLHCARNDDYSLKLQVYNWLNDRVEQVNFDLLRHTNCLLVEGNQYVDPSNVFWREHPFGKYRFQLNDELWAYKSLLEQLGVRKKPDWQDALDVLLEISDEYGNGNKPLDENACGVAMTCWIMLAYALEEEMITEDDLADLEDEKVIPNSQKVLHRPQWMYFEDRPRLKEKFDDLLEYNAIPRPQSAGAAMESAGVRPLSRAVKTELVECVRGAFADDLHERLITRSNLIARVLAVREDVEWHSNLLGELGTYSADRLLLTHTIRAFNRTHTTPAEDALAFFDSSDNTLYFVDGENLSWSAIARELAYALNPAGEAGQIASGIKEVLRAESAEHGQQELSELGFAPLSTFGHLQAPSSKPVGPGAIEDGEEDEEYPPGTDDTSEVGDKDVEEDDFGPTTDEFDDELEGNEDTKLTTKPSQTEGDEQLPGKKPKRKKKQRRLQTFVYVVHDVNGDGKGRGLGIEQIEKVDRAGVDCVLAYEREAGRTPREMPHENPGYDIESLDEYGNIVRYIEVKSTAEEWGETGVGLSDTQFRKAQELGPLYWLYVVECADSEDPQVYPIRDPVNSVDKFMYDGKWRAASQFQEELSPAEKPQKTRSRRRSILDLKEEE